GGWAGRSAPPAPARRRRARSRADSAPQAGAAAPAAATASSTSAALATATEANSSPVAGLTAGARPARPSRHVPPAQIRYSRMTGPLSASGTRAQLAQRVERRGQQPELRAGDGQRRDARPGRVEYRRGDRDPALLQLRGPLG